MTPESAPAPPGRSPRSVVNVLCDETGRVGALSYLVPEGMRLTPGDAVHVPFGKRELHGMVLGPGDASKATREVLGVYGRRAAASEIELAREVARTHFSELSVVASRLSPRSGRGHDPLDAGPVKVAATTAVLPEAAEGMAMRFYLRAPLLDPAELAALDAARLSTRGQVLVLCPTVDLLERVLHLLPSGAARLDSKALPGAWRGFCEGSVRIAVGTRSAALYSAQELAGIVVVEEDHPGHLEASQPYTNARDLAVLRARKLGVDLTLIGANPTTSGLGAGGKAVPAGTRSDWPAIRVVDRMDFAPADRLVPAPLRAAIDRALRSDRPVVVLAEKRKPVRRCARCGDPRPCPSCDESTCRHQASSPCPRCGSDALRTTGWDSARLGDLLGPGVRAVTASELGDVSVGDALVVIFDIDPALSAPTFNPEATASHLLVTAARAAGRSGQLMVLTREPDHPLLVDLCIRKDQVAPAKRAWAGARDAHLPPFGRLVTVRVGHNKEPNVSSWPGRVHGPRRTSDGWEVLVRIPDQDLPKLENALSRLRRGGKVRVLVT